MAQRQCQRQLQLLKESLAQHQRQRQRELERQRRPCKPADKIVECPFDKSHSMNLRTSGGQSHLYQCRNKFVEASGLPIEQLELEQCKYNADHIILSIELDFHETHHCADRPRPLPPPRQERPATSVTSSSGVDKSSIFRVQIGGSSEQSQAGTAKKEEKDVDVVNVEKGLQELSLAKKKKKSSASGNQKVTGFAQYTRALVGSKVDPPQSASSAMGKEGNDNTSTGKDDQQRQKESGKKERRRR